MVVGRVGRIIEVNILPHIDFNGGEYHEKIHHNSITANNNITTIMWEGAYAIF